MSTLRTIKSLIYDHLREMGYSGLNLKIHSFDTNVVNNIEVEGQFDEFLGDRIVFKAVYNQNTKDLISFIITAKKPKGTGLL